MNQPHTVRPTTVLREEHQVILQMLEVLSRLVDRAHQGHSFEAAALGQCVEFFRLFADACHHAKEEDHLFPVLESRGIPNQGGPIGVMLFEHQVARELTRKMGDALEAYKHGDESFCARFCALARQYIDLLTRHITKEDNILFTMGDQVMNDADQQGLCASFCEVADQSACGGCRSVGGKNRDDLAGIADALIATWANGK
jgi:hemerythrin-like domain-containing protein